MGIPRNFFFIDHNIRRTSFLPLLFFLLLCTQKLFSSEVSDSVASHDSGMVHQFTHDDYKMGERLFYGLVREQQGQASCISCHNIKPAPALNWNPSAFDIATISSKKTLNDLKAALHTPVGKKMSEAHTGFTSLSDEQLAQLKGYLQHYYEQGGYNPKPIINKLILFIALCLVFLLSFLDLVWFRLVRFRFVHVFLLLVTALVITRFTVVEAIEVGRSTQYEPDQPIKFSHMVHAGQNQISCLYCHSSAEYGKSAGIPSANVCLNCHMIVREGSRSGRSEINKIFAAIDNKQPIKWTRVYNLPDHAFFSHAQHVGAGKLDCLTCHGNVEQMDRIVQVPDLSMGWCINCHRDTKVQFHDNKFYETYGSLKDKVARGEIDSVTVDMIGGTDCMKCHY